MARKKKEEIIKEVKSEEIISYKGNLKIEIQKNGRIIRTINNHNDGTLNLFKGIALYLSYAVQTNSTILSDYTPRFLGVGTGDTTSTSIQANDLDTPLNLGSRFIVESGPIALHYDQNNNVDGYQLSLHCTIPYTAGLSNQVIKEVGLFGTNNTASLLARVVNSEGITLNPGENLVFT